MMIVVFPFRRSRRDARTVRSVPASRADVNSSRTRRGASRRNARAMEIRCRWPTESVAPRFWILHPTEKSVVPKVSFHRYFCFTVKPFRECPPRIGTNPQYWYFLQIPARFLSVSGSPATLDLRLRTPPAVPAGRLQTNVAPGALPRIPAVIAYLVSPSKDVRTVIVLILVTPALLGRMGADVASWSVAPEAVARTGQPANSGMGTSGHATPEMPPAVKSVSPTISAIRPAERRGILLFL